MRSAGLDERITIRRLESSLSEYGEPIEEWFDLTTVWARIVHLKGAESFEAARIDATRTLKFKIRDRDDLEPTMRIKYDGNEYNIHDIDRSARRADELWITATAHGT